MVASHYKATHGIEFLKKFPVVGKLKKIALYYLIRYKLKSITTIPTIKLNMGR
jgi:hypothetical protein